MRKYLLGSVAVITAITLSAFTSPKSVKPSTELIWFEVDASGIILNPTNGGIKGFAPPAGLNCLTDAFQFCSFGYDESDTVNNNDGTYMIKPESGEFSHLEDREDERYREED